MTRNTEGDNVGRFEQAAQILLKHNFTVQPPTKENDKTIAMFKAPSTVPDVLDDDNLPRGYDKTSNVARVFLGTDNDVPRGDISIRAWSKFFTELSICEEVLHLDYKWNLEPNYEVVFQTNASKDSICKVVLLLVNHGFLHMGLKKESGEPWLLSPGYLPVAQLKEREEKKRLGGRRSSSSSIDTPMDLSDAPTPKIVVDDSDGRLSDREALLSLMDGIIDAYNGN